MLLRLLQHMLVPMQAKNQTNNLPTTRAQVFMFLQNTARQIRARRWGLTSRLKVLKSRYWSPEVAPGRVALSLASAGGDIKLSPSSVATGLP
jgi:hypothetical protein